MVFVAKHWNRDVDLLGAIVLRLGLGALHRTSSRRIPLRGFRRFIRSNLAGSLTLLDCSLFVFGVALTRRGHQSGIDELSANWKIARRGDRLVQALERFRLDQCLTGVLKCLNIGNPVGGAKAAEPHTGQLGAHHVRDMRKAQSVK